MPRKDVYLFDKSNNPLIGVKGIRVELFDAATGTLLDVQNSDDLNNPPAGAPPSNDWGVRLNFAASSNPVDIYFTDPTYKYPGNTVRSLNGQLTDRLDVDLLHLPSSPGGQPGPPTSASPASLSRWVKQGYRWTDEEKLGVLNLAFNFSSVIVPRFDDLPELKELHSVADNWAEGLRRIGLRTDMFTS